MVTQRNKYERHTSREEYENFVTAQKETAAKCIPTKPRA